jgi:hypothetical protein
VRVARLIGVDGMKFTTTDMRAFVEAQLYKPEYQNLM